MEKEKGAALQRNTIRSEKMWGGDGEVEILKAASLISATFWLPTFATAERVLI